VKLGAGAILLVKIAGEAGVRVPERSAAIVASLTVTAPTAASYLTVYPADLASPPVASNLNFTAGQTIATQVTVRLDALGDIKIYNSAGAAHVIVDLAGFYLGGVRQRLDLSEAMVVARFAPSLAGCPDYTWPGRYAALAGDGRGGQCRADPNIVCLLRQQIGASLLDDLLNHLECLPGRHRRQISAVPKP
jgi:hypothetical protein